MKKRRSIIALFLVVAVLTIGIGYANLSDTLSIASEASIKTFDEYVYFKSCSTNDETRATAEIIADNNDTAKVTVTEEMHKGDSVALTFVIENVYSKSVDVSLTFNERNDNFTFSPEWSSTVIEPDGTATLTLTLNLISVPTESISGSIFSVTINAVGRNS